jgi:hypothetical protein
LLQDQVERGQLRPTGTGTGTGIGTGTGVTVTATVPATAATTTTTGRQKYHSCHVLEKPLELDHHLVAGGERGWDPVNAIQVAVGRGLDDVAQRVRDSEGEVLFSHPIH